MKDLKTQMNEVSHFSSEYSSGVYFEEKKALQQNDASFKAAAFTRFFIKIARKLKFSIESYTDVGCGTGDVVKLIYRSLKMHGFDLRAVKGYDIAPQTRDIKDDFIIFSSQDFCQTTNEHADLVTLFDVIEHVPDPIGFIKQVAERCDMIVFHIPLEKTLNIALRDKFSERLRDPGHLLYLDVADALNLLDYAGLRVLSYQYTMNFLAPSGHISLLSKLTLPFRYLLMKLSPYLTSITIGGMSIMVLALTMRGAITWLSAPVEGESTGY